MSLKKRSDLDSIQNKFINLMKRNKCGFYVLPMGAGKTVMALTAATDLINDGKVKKVLIVAPLKVAEATWPDEIEQWEHLVNFKYTLLRCEYDGENPELRSHVNEFFDYFKKNIYNSYPTRFGGTPAERKAFSISVMRAELYKKLVDMKRLELARSNTPFHIINVEALPWLWSLYPKGEGWPYDMLILDESTVAKNGKLRTKSSGKQSNISRFGALVRMSDMCSRNIVMTGTPAPRMIDNLWGQIRIVDGGARLYASKNKFIERWYKLPRSTLQKVFQDNVFWQIKLKEGAKEEILDKISDICFSLDQEDIYKLPPVVKYNFKVDLGHKILEQYKEFKRELYSEPYDVEAINRGVLHGKLLQFANGSLYRSDETGGKPVCIPIHDEKLKALQDIVDDIGDEPVLVAYTFRFDLDRIRSVFKDAVVFDEGDARDIKARWNAGKIKMLLGHPASIGHGQNLQFGGRNAIWYGLTSDLELYQQFNKRLHRRGQTQKVYLYHIIAKGTIDEDILPILENRESVQDDIINVLKV